jgi:hypothetical protein
MDLGSGSATMPFKMKEPSEGGPIVSQIRKLILREREEAILFALAQQSRYFTLQYSRN